MKKSLILGSAAVLLLAACEKAEIEKREYVVADVLDCTEGSSDWNYGYSPGLCRVVYASGERDTVQRPVAVGDTIARCYMVWEKQGLERSTNCPYSVLREVTKMDKLNSVTEPDDRPTHHPRSQRLDRCGAAKGEPQ